MDSCPLSIKGQGGYGNSFPHPWDTPARPHERTAIPNPTAADFDAQGTFPQEPIPPLIEWTDQTPIAVRGGVPPLHRNLHRNLPANPLNGCWNPVNVRKSRRPAWTEPRSQGSIEMVAVFSATDLPPLLRRWLLKIAQLRRPLSSDNDFAGLVGPEVTTQCFVRVGCDDVIPPP